MLIIIFLKTPSKPSLEWIDPTLASIVLFFCRGGRRGIEAVAATNTPCGVIDIRLKNSAEIVPRYFTATCGGEAAFAELATCPPPAWLFRDYWNMVRVTRRGAGTPSEWVRCKFDYKFFRMTFR